MQLLPETGFLRLHQIIGKPGNPNTDPPIPPTVGIIPVSKSTWWAGIASGRFPKPIKLSPRVTVWKISDIREYIENRG